MTKRKNNRSAPRKGVATGVHNAVLDQLQASRRQNANLQRLIACILREAGSPFDVSLEEVPGDWVVTLDDIPTIEKGAKKIRLALRLRSDLKNAEPC